MIRNHMQVIWLLVVFLSGALLPLQAGLNSRLEKSLQSPAYASMFTFMSGAMVVGAYLLLTRESLSWAGVKSTAAYSWFGGVLGVLFISVSILALPRVGMALTFGLVIAGQVCIAVLLDHFNVLVPQQHPLNLWRVLGILLILGGVVIVRKF
jgi:transporter family-2 protein